MAEDFKLPSTASQWRDLVTNRDLNNAKRLGDKATGEEILENILVEKFSYKEAKEGKPAGYRDEQFQYSKLGTDDKIKLALAAREELHGRKEEGYLKAIDTTLESLQATKQAELNAEHAKSLELRQNELRNQFRDGNSKNTAYSALPLNATEQTPPNWDTFKATDKGKDFIKSFADDKSVKDVGFNEAEKKAADDQKGKFEKHKAKLGSVEHSLEEKDIQKFKNSHVDGKRTDLSGSATVQSFVNHATERQFPDKSPASHALHDGKVGVYTLTAMNDYGDRNLASKFMDNIGLNENQKKLIQDLTISDKGVLSKGAYDANNKWTVTPLNDAEKKEVAELQHVLKGKYTDAGFKEAFDVAKNQTLKAYDAEIAKNTYSNTPGAAYKQMESLAQAKYEGQHKAFLEGQATSLDRTKSEANFAGISSEPVKAADYIKDTLKAETDKDKDSQKTINKMREVLAQSKSDPEHSGGVINATDKVTTQNETKMAKLAKQLGMDLVASADNSFHLKSGNVDMGEVGQFVSKAGGVQAPEGTVMAKK